VRQPYTFYTLSPRKDICRKVHWMRLATQNLIMEGLNPGDTVDFGNVRTIKELEETIVDNYVSLCRNCSSESFCKLYDRSQPPCPILKEVVHNYIITNIKSIDAGNQYSLSQFIESVILLTRIFHRFENWRGIYVDKYFNWYFESMHPFLNSSYAHKLLIGMSEFVNLYRIVKTDRIKRFVVLVEGSSEYKALPQIFSALGVRGIRHTERDSVKFINLRGKDSIQRDRIRSFLVQFREEGVSYFLILDNDPGVAQYIEDLKRENLINDNHYIIWKSRFEDNFGEGAILKVLKEEDPIFGQIGIEELRRCNSKKNDIGNSIGQLLRERGIDRRFDDYKVKIAGRLSEWVCKEIKESMHENSGGYNGNRIPTSKTFPSFVEKLRKITEEMKRINSEFHVIRK
jgi:hypothetical protein